MNNLENSKHLMSAVLGMGWCMCHYKSHYHKVVTRGSREEKKIVAVVVIDAYFRTLSLLQTQSLLSLRSWGSSHCPVLGLGSGTLQVAMPSVSTQTYFLPSWGKEGRWHPLQSPLDSSFSRTWQAARERHSGRAKGDWHHMMPPWGQWL